MLDAKLALAFVLGALSGAAAEHWSGKRSDERSPDASTQATPKQDPSVSGDACDACIAAATSGTIAAAANNAGKCTDAAKKAQCQGIVKKKAPDAAQTAAFNQQCGMAKAIVAAAESMGAGSSKLKRAVESCK